MAVKHLEEFNSPSFEDLREIYNARMREIDHWTALAPQLKERDQKIEALASENEALASKNEEQARRIAELEKDLAARKTEKD